MAIKFGVFGLAALVVLAACGDDDRAAEIPCGVAPEPAGMPEATNIDDYVITVTACEIDPSSVAMTIETNLPVPVDVIVGLNIAELPPKTIYIGHAEQVRLNAAQTVHLMDLSKLYPPLPGGSYDARVAFHAFAPRDDGTIPVRGDVDIDVWAMTDVTLSGAEPTANDAAAVVPEGPPEDTAVSE